MERKRVRDSSRIHEFTNDWGKHHLHSVLLNLSITEASSQQHADELNENVFRFVGQVGRVVDGAVHLVGDLVQIAKIDALQRLQICAVLLLTVRNAGQCEQRLFEFLCGVVRGRGIEGLECV